MLGSLFNFSGKINSFLKSSKVLIYFRAMAAEAEAAREARAKVIAAEGEHKASRALRHAAEVINDSPAALQVRNFSSNRNSEIKICLISVEISPNPEQYFC